MQIPIEHISYSAMRQLFSNPWMFKKQYILGMWDIKDSPALLEGKAIHTYCEHKYSGKSFDEAVQLAFNEILNVDENKVEWGKTGSKEKSTKIVEQLVAFWELYEWQPEEVIATEKSNVVAPLIGEQRLVVPLKAKTDLVEKQSDGTIKIHDWKSCTSFKNRDYVDPGEIIQAMFNYFTIKELYGTPYSITYHEIKKSKNRDESPQVKPYEIVYEDYPEYFTYFGELYARTIQALGVMSHYDIFLPNLFNYDSKQTWDDFVSECNIIVDEIL